LHKAALRCCCRSPLAAAAAWSSPLLLHAAQLLLLHGVLLLSGCLRSGSSIWELASAARYLDFRPASGRGERRKTLREA
jgi:hypothetical protein